MEDLKKKIAQVLEAKLAELDLFLVEVLIGANFKIQVFVDGIPSITIQQCAVLSRIVEAYLDEAPSIPEKYTLEVSSPGMSNPLRVPQQYIKRIGSTLKLTLNDGQQIAIILKEVNDENLVGLKTTIQEKSKKPTKTIKEEALESVSIDIKQVKQALLHFNF